MNKQQMYNYQSTTVLMHGENNIELRETVNYDVNGRVQHQYIVLRNGMPVSSSSSYATAYSAFVAARK